jgi:hypothetical protein
VKITLDSQEIKQGPDATYEDAGKVEFEIDYGENRLKITADGGATHCVRLYADGGATHCVRLYDAKKLLGLI